MYNQDHTIEDRIVRDVYSAVSEVHGEEMFFSGGMSLQLFLPRRFHRGSNDVDTNGVAKFSYGQFKDKIGPCLESLAKEKPYKIKSRKRRYTYDFILTSENGESIILQYPNRGGSEWAQRVVERENANAQKVPFENRYIRVISTEDSVLHKLLRSDSFMKNHNLREPNPDLSLKELGRRIKRLKDDYTLNRFNLEPEETMKWIARIRLLADIFDIKAIATYRRLDRSYLIEGMQDYRRLRDSEGEIKEKLERMNPRVFT
jgi:hypothetical protein